MISKRILAGLLVFIFVGVLLSQIANTVENNLQVNGWLMNGPRQTWAQERTWASGGSGDIDTVVITGVDTDCIAVFGAKTTLDHGLVYDFETDTLFVTSDSAETSGKYSFVIVQNGYGATD